MQNGKRLVTLQGAAKLLLCFVVTILNGLAMKSIKSHI